MTSHAELDSHSHIEAAQSGPVVPPPSESPFRSLTDNDTSSAAGETAELFNLDESAAVVHNHETQGDLGSDVEQTTKETRHTRAQVPSPATEAAPPDETNDNTRKRKVADGESPIDFPTSPSKQATNSIDATESTMTVTNSAEPTNPSASRTATTAGNCNGSNKKARTGPARVSWDDRVASLATYKEQHGDLNIPIRYKANPSLGKFVHNTREQFKLYHGRTKPGYQKTCSLTADRIAQLDAMGFLWTTERVKRQNEDWASRWEQLKEYKAKHGVSFALPVVLLDCSGLSHNRSTHTAICALAGGFSMR
jgi:Helicase associated domain